MTRAEKILSEITGLPVGYLTGSFKYEISPVETIKAMRKISYEMLRTYAIHFHKVAETMDIPPEQRPPFNEEMFKHYFDLQWFNSQLEDTE